MKFITLIGTYLLINVVLSIKVIARANEPFDSKLSINASPKNLLNTNTTSAEINTTFNLNGTGSEKQIAEDQIDPEKLEIPKIIAANTDNFMSDPIKSLNVDINRFNNINDPNLKRGLDINKISDIQVELLNRLKDNIKLNLLNSEDSGKVVVVTSKKVPILKRKNNDNPTVTWEN